MFPTQRRFTTTSIAYGSVQKSVDLLNDPNIESKLGSSSLQLPFLTYRLPYVVFWDNTYTLHSDIYTPT